MRFWKRLESLLPSNRRMRERDMQEELESIRAMADPKELGNLTRVAEDSRTVWTWTWVENLGQDVRYTFRSLARSPMFAAVVVLTLALGIGANTAIFSVVHTLVFKPLPYPEPEQLMKVDLGSRGGSLAWAHSVFTAFRDNQTSLSSVAVYTDALFTVAIDQPFKVNSEVVTASYFSLFGIETEIGRTFQPEEDRIHAGTFDYFDISVDRQILARTVTISRRGDTLFGQLNVGAEIELSTEAKRVSFPGRPMPSSHSNSGRTAVSLPWS